MQLGQPSEVLDLSDYDDQMRDQILDELRLRSVDPTLYGILVWSLGLSGLHKCYIESYVGAALHFGLFAVALLMAGTGIADVNFERLVGALGLIGAAALWWLIDLAVQKHAVLRAQFAKEQRLLTTLKSVVRIDNT